MLCRDKCIEKNELVHHKSDDLANFNASLLCTNGDVITIKHNYGTWVILRSTSNGSWDYSTQNILLVRF